MDAWSTEVRDDLSVFAELRDWWNSCPGPQASPFLRSEWFELWAENFLPDGARLEVVVVRRNGGLAAALPLFRKGPQRWSLSNSHSDLFDVISDGDHGASGQIRNWLASRPVTRLFRLDASSLLIPEVSSTEFEITHRSRPPFVDLAGGPEGVVARLPGGLVKDLRRRMRRLQEAGEVAFVNDAQESIDGAFEECMRLEAAGWKGASNTAILSSTDTTGFYRGLVAVAQELGWLRLYALTVDSRIVAYELNLEYANRLHALKVGYDEDLKKTGPGNLLALEVLRDAASEGLSSAEWGGEDDEYKMRWTDQTRERVTALQYGSSGLSGAVGSALRVAKRLRGVASGP